MAQTEASAVTGTATFRVNVAAVGAVGAGVAWWVSRYTDWLVSVPDLVGVAGVVAWLGVLGKVLPKDSGEAFQAAVERKVLRRRWTSVVVIALLPVLLAGASFAGAIELDPHGLVGRTVRLTAADGGRVDEIEVGEKTVKTKLTRPWRPARYTVKLGGYPATSVEVSSFGRISLRIPDSFERRVLLVRPSAGCLQAIGQNPRRLTVTIGSRHFDREEYKGEAYWLSSDDDLDVPPQLVERWRRQFGDVRQVDELMAAKDWLRPRPLFSDELSLAPGTMIKVELEDHAPVVVSVKPPGIGSEYVQEVVLP